MHMLGVHPVVRKSFEVVQCGKHCQYTGWYLPHETAKSLSYSTEKSPPSHTHLLLYSKKYSSVYFSLSWWMSLMLYLYSIVSCRRTILSFLRIISGLLKKSALYVYFNLICCVLRALLWKQVMSHQIK